MEKEKAVEQLHFLREYYRIKGWHLSWICGYYDGFFLEVSKYPYNDRSLAPEYWVRLAFSNSGRVFVRLNSYSYWALEDAIDFYAWLFNRNQYIPPE